MARLGLGSQILPITKLFSCEQSVFINEKIDTKINIIFKVCDIYFVLFLIIKLFFIKRLCSTMKYSNIENSIGKTPLVSIFSKNFFAKLEYFNPGGSIKDRSAWYMLNKAEKEGLLKPGNTIIDASSGNHGIALAMLGAIKGYPVIITTSTKTSIEKMRAMEAYGAHVIVCEPTAFIEDPASYHSRAITLARSIPNSFMPNQYMNPINAEAHYYLLGPEIWNDTKGEITHFFAAAGTGGTISGVGRYLKEQNKDIRVIAVDSKNSFRSTNGNPKPYKVEGMGIDFNSPVLDVSVIDEFFPVTDEEAFAALKILAHNHGLLVGPSSGAVAHAAFAYLKHEIKPFCAVMICGDSGRAYLTRQLYGSAQEQLSDSSSKEIESR